MIIIFKLLNRHFNSTNNADNLENKPILLIPNSNLSKSRIKKYQNTIKIQKEYKIINFAKIINKIIKKNRTGKIQK